MYQINNWWLLCIYFVYLFKYKIYQITFTSTTSLKHLGFIFKDEQTKERKNSTRTDGGPPNKHKRKNVGAKMT